MRPLPARSVPSERRARWWPAALLGLWLPVAAFAQAPPLESAPPSAGEEGEAAGWRLTGDFELGLRSVDVDGASAKYREDVNLDDGARLFGLSLRLDPASAAGAVDRLELSAGNLGGDPFETLRFEVGKLNRFSFTYERLESEYFYDDLIVPPPLASIAGSTGGDFHTFDFERIRDRARLSVEVSPRSTLRLGFDGHRKKGESTTTLDLQRDEFELDRPLDETLNDYRAGFEHRWDTVTLWLEERVRDYENLVEIFLPGASPGENTEDPASLSFFFLDQPYDFTSLEHTARVVYRPNERWDVRAAATLGRLGLDVDADQDAAGTTFAGAPFTLEATGDGAIDRDTELFDLDWTYRVSDRWALTGGARRHRLDQEGDFRFGAVGEPPAGDDERRGRWEVDLQAVELGAEVQISPAWSAAAGVSLEDRQVTTAASAGGDELTRDEETGRTGWVATLAWRPSARLRLAASVEDSSFDDPYTLVAPTDRRRLRLLGRYRWGGGWSLNGHYTLRRVDNDDSGWSADTDQAAIRLARDRERYDLAVGWSRLDLDRAVDRLVQGGTRTVLFPIAYEAQADLFDARGRVKLSDGWAVGGAVLLYENGGSFALDRDDLRLWVEVPVAQYRLRIGGRRVSYDERDFDFDDYDADLLEVGVGYSF
jgi:hypothetical protein